MIKALAGVYTGIKAESLPRRNPLWSFDRLGRYYHFRLLSGLA